MSFLSRRLHGLAVIAFWAALSVAVLAGTTLLSAWLASLARDEHFLEPRNLYIGLVIGLVAWLFVAVFHLGKDQLTLTFSHREGFISAVRLVLEGMGYEVIHQSKNRLTTRPGFQALLLGEGIHVVLEGNQARCIGPKVCLESLRRRLRAFHHLRHVQQSIHDSRTRQPDRFFKRIEIEVRLNWIEQLAELQTSLAEVLGREGAIVLDVRVLAQNENGIRESTVEQQIRPWLEQQQLAYDLHKDNLIRVDGEEVCERKSLMEVTI
jgi:hypothetical protein